MIFWKLYLYTEPNYRPKHIYLFVVACSLPFSKTIISVCQNLSIGDIAKAGLPDIKLPKKIPFAEPSKDQGMIDLVKNKVIDKATDIASDKTQQVLNAAQQAASDLYQA